MQAIKTFVPLFVGAFVAVYVTFQGDGMFSTFAVGLAKYALAVTGAWFVDTFLISEVNTREILAKNPIAYAIFVSANIITAALCFGAA
jgi:hypothetical protein